MTTLDNSGIQVTLRSRSGTDFSALVRVKDSATGEPFDLTGYTGVLRVYTDTEVIDVVCTVTGNEISYTIAHTITAVLPPQSSYELLITSPADRITCLKWGALLIQQNAQAAAA